MCFYLRKRVVCSQYQSALFFPYCGFFVLLAKSDVFISLDDVNMRKMGFKVSGSKISAVLNGKRPKAGGFTWAKHRYSCNIYRRRKRLGNISSSRGIEGYGENACSNLLGTKLIKHAGHWVQQEKPKAVLDIIEKILISD